MADNPSEYFGCKVFSQKIMQEKLPKVTYKALIRASPSTSRWPTSSPML